MGTENLDSGRIAGMCAMALMLSVSALAVRGDMLSEYVRQFNADDDERYTNAIPNTAAEAFLRENIPMFECPDKEIERTYYFRWWTYRKHLRRTADGGWVVTEFLPDVSWARTNNTIFCAMGHHLMEGRWLRDGAFLESYLRFWFKGAGRPHRRLYTSWPVYAALEWAKVRGDDSLLRELYDSLCEYFDVLEKGWWTPTGPLGHCPLGRWKNGLFGVEDWREGCELSASGHGNRPLHNAVMWREAEGLAELGRRFGRTDAAAKYEAKAEISRRAILERLWSPERAFFMTVGTNGVQGTARELQGYAPWYVDMPLDVSHGAAWQWVLRQAGGRVGFRARYGLTTTDMSDPGFGIFRIKGEDCRWNGPTWPFASSIALSGLANALRSGTAGPATKEDFAELVHEYAAAHRRKREDGKTVCWIDENMDPFTGEWLARAIHISRGVVNERGKDYNHSTFCDLIISGLVGVRPSFGPGIEVRPLAPKSWDWYRLSNLPYHGQMVDIVFDRTGTRYGCGKGMTIRVTK